MSKYEIAVVVSVMLEDEDRVQVIEKIKDLVQRYEGNVTNVDDWGKKKLAYEIGHQKEAFYYFIQFDAEATAPAEIENRVRIMDNVIRFLCVRANEA